MKNTKRTLTVSALSLLLCVSMLVGSTFAWFTDKASTGVNNIVSGNLDVDLQDASGNSLDGKTLSFKNVNGSADILWEPGCTYNLEEIYVVNKGNLALRYQIAITGINGDEKLNEAIEWTMKIGEETLALGTPYALSAGEKSPAVVISGHMKETAGNEYKDLKITGISITVLATQLNKENDSFGPDYDKFADIAFVLDQYTNTVEVTPETARNLLGDNNLVDNTVYVLKAGNYTSLVNDARGKNIAIVGEPGAVVTGNAQVGNSHNGGTVVVEGLTVEGHLVVGADFENIYISRNTVDSLWVAVGDAAENIVVKGNTVDGEGYTSSNDKYNLYINGHAAGANLTVEANTFKNSYSHAVSVQGSGANAFGNISVTDNTFINWGTNGETDRGAFKIWSDDKYAPSAPATAEDMTVAMAELSNQVISENTFNKENGTVCMVNVFGLTVGTVVSLPETSDMTQADVQNAFNQAGNGGVIDFNGSTVEQEPGSAYAMYYPKLPSGNSTVQNLNFDGSLYGLEIHGDITFKDSSFVGQYAMNISDGNPEAGKVTFINCTFQGWLSFAAASVTSAEFINCTFEAGPNTLFMNNYQDTTFTNCTFDASFGIDDELAAEQTWKFIGCTGLNEANINKTGSYKTVTVVIE